MTKTVVITQSNYIPWRGYFDLLRSADEVVLLESVQYTRRDWRNRNVIKTPQGTTWLTIPVEAKGRYLQALDETRISDSRWADSHIRTIELAYSRAPHFADTVPWLFDLLRGVAAEPLLTRSTSNCSGRAASGSVLRRRSGAAAMFSAGMNRVVCSLPNGYSLSRLRLARPDISVARRHGTTLMLSRSRRRESKFYG